MAWLPDGEKNLQLCLCVSTECKNVTDRWIDGQTPHDDIGCAYASHRVAKMSHMLWAVALKTVADRAVINLYPVCCSYNIQQPYQ